MLLLFFFNDTPTTEIYTLSLHDALPISIAMASRAVTPATLAARCCSFVTVSVVIVLFGSKRFYGINASRASRGKPGSKKRRSEEHTSELQSPCNLVCRLLLGKNSGLRTT